MIMKAIVLISRLLVGLTFIFSGFVKAVDPVGTEIKFHDYLEAMGLNGWIPLALMFSFLLNGAELLIGLMLVFNIFPKLTGTFALLFMLLFTPVTLWLALGNPVSDCGCFGDAVKLSNWETFWKNVVLLVLIIIFLILNRKNKSHKVSKKNIIFTLIFVIIAFGFEFYNYYNLPIIDFLPFKKGVNIIEESSIPANAAPDVYQTDIYYKNLKTGESKAFSIDNIPYQDTLNWAYDTTITELLKKGYEPPIQDFFLTSVNGEELTDSILSYNGYTYIIVMHEIDKGYTRVENRLFEIAEFALKYQIPFYCFTSSGSQMIEEYAGKFPENLIICTADYKMLKSMIRSNPGFVIIKNAVIINKYHYLNIPENRNLPK